MEQRESPSEFGANEFVVSNHILRCYWLLPFKDWPVQTMTVQLTLVCVWLCVNMFTLCISACALNSFLQHFPLETFNFFFKSRGFSLQLFSSSYLSDVSAECWSNQTVSCQWLKRQIHHPHNKLQSAPPPLGTDGEERKKAFYGEIMQNCRRSKPKMSSKYSLNLYLIEVKVSIGLLDQSQEDS